MNSESERPRTNSRLWVRTASVETQASSNRGRLPKSSLLSPVALITKVYGPLRRTYRYRWTGLVRGRLHSAPTAALGARRRGLLSPGAGQIGDDFTDGNQTVLLTPHSSFPHVPQTRQGHHCRASIPETASLELETLAG